MEESREMATMEDVTGGAQLDYRQIAKLLRERLNAFLEGGSGELPGDKFRHLLYMAASHKVVSYTFMNPVLWGRLPRELLPLILARLSVPEITRLLCQLSKQWTMNMEFNQACDEANPNLAALLFYAREPNEFSVRIFDFSKYIWLYEYRFRLTNRGNPPSRSDSIGYASVWMPLADDGGLVCFVSTWLYTEANPLCIVVINPLTRVQHELPSLQHAYTVPPALVHMKVDSETKGYKVVVVVKRKAGCYTVETYDSVSREWSSTAPSWGRILGRGHQWRINDGNCFEWLDSWSCVFDPEEGQLEFLDYDYFQTEGMFVIQYAPAGDRMFALNKKILNRSDIEPEFYFVTEFRSQNSAEVWVPVGTDVECFTEDGAIYLHTCEDILMLRERIYSTNQICCILNFSTREWHNLPEISLENQDIYLMDDQDFSLICRVFWNAFP